MAGQSHSPSLNTAILGDIDLTDWQPTNESFKKETKHVYFFVIFLHGMLIVRLL
jgi:hypothetical protein